MSVFNNVEWAIRGCTTNEKDCCSFISRIVYDYQGRDFSLNVSNNKPCIPVAVAYYIFVTGWCQEEWTIQKKTTSACVPLINGSELYKFLGFSLLSVVVKRRKNSSTLILINYKLRIKYNISRKLFKLKNPTLAKNVKQQTLSYIVNIGLYSI